jgi:hypothetical protein
MVWLIVVVVAVAVLVAAFRMSRPWLEEHGWIFPKGESGNVGTAMLHIQALLEPNKQHVIEWQDFEEVRGDEADSGDPGDDDIDDV